MLTWLLPLLGFVVVAYFVAEVGLEESAAALRQAGWGLVALFVLPLFLFVVHAIGWSYTLSVENRRKIGLFRLTLLQTFSYGISGVLPMQAVVSEPLKLAFLKGTGVDKEDFASSLLVDNTINAVAIIIVALMGLFYFAYALVSDTGLRLLVGGVTLLVGLGLVGLIALQRRGLFVLVLDLLACVPQLRPFTERKRAQAEREDTIVRRFYATDRRGFLLSLFCHVLEKAHGLVEVWLIFQLLGMDVPWSTCFFVFAVLNTLDNLLFFVQVGGMEAWMSSLLTWLEVARESVNIKAALLRRLRFVFWAIVATALIPWTRRLMLRGEAKHIVEAQGQPSLGASGGGAGING